MEDRLDETSHDIILQKFESHKKYKEHILRELVAAISALLNSNGGKVVLHFQSDSKVEDNKLLFVIRVLEQHMISIIGENQTVSKINFKDDADDIIIFVMKADFLITVNYNLYLPSQTQVVAVSPSEPLENVKNDIMYRKAIPNPVELGSHCQMFCKDKKCGFHESKVCQFKNVKANQSKCTTLADRITSKGNKFSRYVSAFANYRGGHIQIGIKDDGIVKGEFIPNEKDKGQITKKVGESIKKMIWPEQISQPKRGEHWEIFFEPVVDQNSSNIPLTFVIVIYIAPCLGGVFTEEPECYEMVKGKVQKMSFTTWKKRSVRSDWLSNKEKIPSSVPRITWSSTAARKTFIDRSENLRKLINDGKWGAFWKVCPDLRKNSQMDTQIKLLLLSKQVTACFRRSHFSDARCLLDQYMDILPEAEDALIFELVGLHTQAALQRAIGDFNFEETLTAALSIAEQIEPGPVTAAMYAFAALKNEQITLEDPTNKFPTDVLSFKALEHLQYVKDCPHFCADKAQKAHMTLATFYLRCSISGRLRWDNIDISEIEIQNAKTHIMAVYELTCGNPLSCYREVQLNLVWSIYYFRRSQVSPDEKVYFLCCAFDYAEKAECLARDNQFRELTEWAKANKASCTEELVRAKLVELELQFVIH